MPTLKSIFFFAAATSLVLLLLATSKIYYDGELNILKFLTGEGYVLRLEHPRDVGSTLPGAKGEDKLNNLQSDMKYWRSRPEHKALMNDKNFRPLSTKQVKGVEKLLFFTGYPRSGHSIVGSLLDAHPNIILSYGFFLFRGLKIPSGQRRSIEGLLQNKTAFFNAMHELSYLYSQVSSNKTSKGYTLDVPGMWSGRHNGTLKVIGDKSASATTSVYLTTSHENFTKMYQHLAECTDVELVAVHVVRSPYDMIATESLYRFKQYSWKKQQSNSREIIPKPLLEQVIEYYLNKAKAVKEMVPLCSMKVIEVHSEDLITSPRKQLLRLCKFLDVHCSEMYLKTCENKVFPEISRTRDKIMWPPGIKEDIDKRMQDFPFFRGYTFQDDVYHPP